MKLNAFLFKSCAAQSSRLDVLLIRCLAVVLGLLGGFYTYFWIRWLIVPFVPHPRAWLDPYLGVGIPLFIFAVGLFRLSRFFVFVTAISAFLIASIFAIGAFDVGCVEYRAIIAVLSFLLFAGRLFYIALSK